MEREKGGEGGWKKAKLNLIPPAVSDVSVFCFSLFLTLLSAHGVCCLFRGLGRFELVFFERLGFEGVRGVFALGK